MGKIRKLAGDAMWYGLSSILGRLFTFVLTPLYTSKYVFSVAEYGIITKLYAYAGFLMILFLYGMETSFFRFATKNHSQSLDYYRLATSSLLTTSIIFSSIIIVMSSDIAVLIGYPDGSQIIQWMALIFAIDAIVAIPFAKLRLENRAKKFAFIRLTNVIMILLLNLFFLVVCNEIYVGNLFKPFQPLVTGFYDPTFKVQYVFISNLLANGLMILMLWKEFRQFRFKVNCGMFGPMLLYAWPLLIMGLASITNDMLSRAMLEDWLPEGFYQHLTSREAAGIFGACFKLSIFIKLGIEAFRYAAEPFFFSHADDKESPLLFSRVMLGFVAFNCIVIVAISLNLDLIAAVVLSSSEYHQALFIVPILLMAYLFQGIYYNLSVWFKVTDKTIYGAIINSIGAIVTIALNIILIPILGFLGSALAALSAFFIMVAISYLLGQKHYPIPYPVKRIVVYLLSAGLWVAVFIKIDLEYQAPEFILKNVLVLVFILLVYLAERSKLKGMKVLGYTLP